LEVSVNQINGLPAHILLVHAVVVLVPLAALLTVAVAWWPTLRRRLGIITPIFTLVAAAFVPFTTHAGEWLEGRVAHSDLIEKHAGYGDKVLPWAALLAAASVGVWLLGRYLDAHESARRPWITIVAGVVTTIIAAGAVVAVVRAGDSGAQATWQAQVSSTSTTDGDDG
jgi:hypothetical protein